jgi:DNA-binding transcriptional MocR family regulator
MGVKKREYLYEQLAAQLAEKIKKGVYQHGEKLPSIQQLHRRLNLSVSTIYKAFIELEYLGLVEAKPKSGFYTQYQPHENESIPSDKQIKAYSAQRDSSKFAHDIHLTIKKPSLVPFGQATISPSLLPHQQLAKILKATIASNLQSMISYGKLQGMFELRRQLALRTVNLGCHVNPDEIVITNGCIEAISISLMALTKPGDTIAVESPTYFGYVPILKQLGLSVIEIPTDCTVGPDLDWLEAAINLHKISVCLLIPNFHNPTGYLISDKNKERLVKLLNEHNIPIVEDDVYAELFYAGKRPTSLKAYDKKRLVITCSSFSKTLAPGFRTGWIMAEGELLEAIKRSKFAVSLATSNLDQNLLAEYLTSNAYDRHLRSLRTILKKQVRSVAAGIEIHFPRGTTFNLPKGGFILWVRLPPGSNGMALYRKAILHKISILPGVLCSYSKTYKEYIRIGCGFPFDKKMSDAIATLGRLAHSLEKEC